MYSKGMFVPFFPSLSFFLFAIPADTYIIHQLEEGFSEIRRRFGSPLVVPDDVGPEPRALLEREGSVNVDELRAQAENELKVLDVDLDAFFVQIHDQLLAAGVTIAIFFGEAQHKRRVFGAFHHALLGDWGHLVENVVKMGWVTQSHLSVE